MFKMTMTDKELQIALLCVKLKHAKQSAVIAGLNIQMHFLTGIVGPCRWPVASYLRVLQSRVWGMSGSGNLPHEFPCGNALYIMMEIAVWGPTICTKCT